MECTKMMDEESLSKFAKIETTKQFYSIPKSDYVLIIKRGVQHHKIHKPDCNSIQPTLSLNSNKSDNSDATYSRWRFPPRNSHYYHIDNDHELILNAYNNCTLCMKLPKTK